MFKDSAFLNELLSGYLMFKKDSAPLNELLSDYLLFK
jgi:hypothetical protein